MIEAAMTSEQNEPRRCLGTNQDGSPCGTAPELLMPSGYCFAHDPARGLDRSAAGTLGGVKAGAKRRKGIDVGELNSPADGVRIVARIAVAVAAGELPAEQGRVVLAAIAEWRKCYEADVLDKRLDEIERKGGRN